MGQMAMGAAPRIIDCHQTLFGMITDSASYSRYVAMMPITVYKKAISVRMSLRFSLVFTKGLCYFPFRRPHRGHRLTQ